MTECFLGGGCCKVTDKLLHFSRICQSLKELRLKQSKLKVKSWREPMNLA